MVLCDSALTPQRYLELVTGNSYCITLNNQYDCIRRIMKSNGVEDLWDFPLREIDHVLENGNNVVLVVMYPETDSRVCEFRWFEVPEGITETDIEKIT